MTGSEKTKILNFYAQKDENGVTNAEKAEKLLGWRAEKNIDDMCRDGWNFQAHCKD